MHHTEDYRDNQLGYNGVNTMMNEEMQEKLDKVYLEVNTAENALGRALYALKALQEQILAHVCDHTDCGEHSHEPPVEPTPTDPVEPAPVEPTPPVSSESIWKAGLTPIILSQAELDTWAVPSVNSHGPAHVNDQAAFRFFGNWTGELNYDDVLLYPGQPNKAHLHIYSGLPGINAFSTLDSMLQTKETYWVGNGTMRPAMWHPASLLDGQVKIHDYVELYYKQRAMDEFLPGFPAHMTDLEIRAARDERAAIIVANTGVDLKTAKSQAQLELCREYHAANGTVYGPENIPTGLCLIGGHHMDGTQGNCQYRLQVPGQPQLKAPTITQVVEQYRTLIGDPLAETPVGSTIIEVVAFPTHWNGELGSADFRSHLKGAERNDRTNWMTQPHASHPRTIIQVTAFRKWSQATGEAPISLIRLASDGNSMEAGQTGHCDYISLWPENIKEMWYENIIKEHLSASTSGSTINYGGLTARNDSHTLNGWKGHPRFVPIPSNPSGGHHH